MDNIREISNLRSIESLAMEIYSRSGDYVSPTKLRRASAQGWLGFKELKLTLAQFKAISEMTGLNFEELLLLMKSPETKNSRSEESESDQSI